MPNSFAQNKQDEYNPGSYHGTAPQIVGQNAQYTLDPFNLTGWNQAPAYSSPQPGRPGYLPGYDPATMALTPEIQARLDALKLDTSGLDAFRKEALRRGPSTWANLQNQKQFAEEGNARDQATSQGRSARAGAESDLAMRGGLSSGARERIARKGASDVLAMGQDVSRQGNLNRMQIGIQDQTNKIGELSQLPGMENQAFQPLLQKESMWDTAKQSDMARQLAENNQRNQYNQNVYQQQMSAWAADRQAYATENAGKK